MILIANEAQSFNITNQNEFVSTIVHSFIECHCLRIRVL